MASGALQRLATIGPDNGTTRSNDSRAHPRGTFWTSIMGRKAEMHMPSDRPGMIMRKRLLALLQEHGEREVHG